MVIDYHFLLSLKICFLYLHMQIQQRTFIHENLAHNKTDILVFVTRVLLLIMSCFCY